LAAFLNKIEDKKCLKESLPSWGSSLPFLMAGFFTILSDYLAAASLVSWL